MLEAIFDGQSDAATHQLERILGPDHFFHFDFELDPFGKILRDGTNPAQTDAIIRAADDFLSQELLAHLAAASWDFRMTNSLRSASVGHRNLPTEPMPLPKQI